MSPTADLVARTLAGEGALFETWLDQRAHDLAGPPETLPSGRPVLRCRGRGAGYAFELGQIARVEALSAWTAIPGRDGPVLGLAMLGGRRHLLAELDAVLAGLPPREPGRGGFALLVRDQPVALAVDRAEAVELQDLPRPGPGGLVVVAGDGTVVVDAAAVAARLRGREGRP